MADKQNPNDPQYDWLYSGHEGSYEPSSEDPDATQRIERQPAPEAGTSAEGPEPTQVLHMPPQETSQPAARPKSFGGTYDASRREGPTGATPAETRPRGDEAPPQRPSQTGPRRPRRRRNWWLRGLLILLLAWLVFLIAVPLWAYSQITTVDAEPGGDRPEDTAGTTFLLVGSDSREDLTAKQQADLGTGDFTGQRTDTIIMLHVPDGDGPTLLLSIPRDSFLAIPGHDKNKVNAAYAFGGPKLLVQTLEQATGVHIDDYVELGFSGFVDIVDAVGGIEICPKQAINDPKAGPLKLNRGCQEADGRTALGYSRSRAFPLGDITRALHQREVMTAVGSKAASWQTIVLPWRYFTVNKAAADTLRVGENVGPIDLIRFAWAMAHTGGKDAKRCVVPYSSLSAQTSAGSSVLWDEQKADAMFTAIREDDTAAIDCLGE